MGRFGEPLKGFGHKGRANWFRLPKEHWPWKGVSGKERVIPRKGIGGFPLRLEGRIIWWVLNFLERGVSLGIVFKNLSFKGNLGQFPKGIWKVKEGLGEKKFPPFGEEGIWGFYPRGGVWDQIGLAQKFF